MLALLACAFVYCLCVGKYQVTPGETLRIIFSKLSGGERDWAPMAESVIFGLRLPRILASMVVGAALSISGAAYQGIFRNPLVSPDFLGVSSGACIGAAIAILMGLTSGFMQAFAFAGGLIAVSITVAIPRFMRSTSNIMLVLSGIIVGGLMSSILGFIKYIADPLTQLADITYWQLGSFSYISTGALLSILPTIVIPAVILFCISWWIDVMSLGEKEAQTLGVNIYKVRNVVVLCATLLTASSVCIAGTIGWVGLVIPHFGRMIVGPNNTRLLPAVCLLGALFMLMTDTLTRTIGAAEMPISILTGIVGAPFYAWLLYRQRMRLR
jgi:iron complex transport system permease protein